jgi:hypothetical protein
MDYKDDYDKYDDYIEEEGYEEVDEEQKKPTKKIEVDEVVGFGQNETFAEVCIPLCPPAFEVMEELISKKIVFDALVASKDKVFINGRIIKDIPYKTRMETRTPGCKSISKLTFGSVKHVTAEIPFAMCIDVPGSQKGLKVKVLEANVESVEIPGHLGCVPNGCVTKCEPSFIKNDPCMRRLIHSITEKDCIFVKVKVVKPTIITLPHKHYEEC